MRTPRRVSWHAGHRGVYPNVSRDHDRKPVELPRPHLVYLALWKVIRSFFSAHDRLVRFAATVYPWWTTAALCPNWNSRQLFGLTAPCRLHADFQRFSRWSSSSLPGTLPTLSVLRVCLSCVCGAPHVLQTVPTQYAMVFPSSCCTVSTRHVLPRRNSFHHPRHKWMFGWHLHSCKEMKMFW